jgi:hypothetical protein
MKLEFLTPVQQYNLVDRYTSFGEHTASVFKAEKKEHRKLYCHVLVTRHGVWIGNLIYWTFIILNNK